MFEHENSRLPFELNEVNYRWHRHVAAGSANLGARLGVKLDDYSGL